MRRSWTLLEQRRPPRSGRNAQSAFLSQVVRPPLRVALPGVREKATMLPSSACPARFLRRASSLTRPTGLRSRSTSSCLPRACPASAGRSCPSARRNGARWMGTRHLNRLRRARDLLAAREVRNREHGARVLQSGSGFDEETPRGRRPRRGVSRRPRSTVRPLIRVALPRTPRDPFLRGSADRTGPEVPAGRERDVTASPRRYRASAAKCPEENIQRIAGGHHTGLRRGHRSAATGVGAFCAGMEQHRTHRPSLESRRLTIGEA